MVHPCQHEEGLFGFGVDLKMILEGSTTHTHVQWVFVGSGVLSSISFVTADLYLIPLNSDCITKEIIKNLIIKVYLEKVAECDTK